MRSFRAAVAAVLCLFAFPALAEMPDKDKWHVNEPGRVNNAVLCVSKEAATTVLPLRIAAQENGMSYPAFVSMAAKMGCFMVSGNVVFGGIVADIPPVTSVKLEKTFVIVRFTNPGGEAFTWLPADAVSDLPYEKPAVIPQMYRGVGGIVLRPA